MRILLPLVAGIALAMAFPIPPGAWIVFTLPVLLALAGFYFFLPGYNREVAGGAMISLFFLLLGFYQYRQVNKPLQPIPAGIYQATLLEKPVLKNRSYRAEGIITAVFRRDSLSGAKEKIIIYFAGDDSLATQDPGTVILFSRTPAMIENRGNPFDFDYKGYIARKGIHRQVFLNRDSWRTAGTDPVFRLTVYAEKTRDYLLGIYSRNGLSGTEYEILSALTLGYKKSMDAEIKQVFSATGAAHVLAVSGLHVGIVYMVFNLFFGFLRRQKAMRYLFLILAVLFLWGFAFITGLSPSVQRSALMFTVVLAGDNLRRPANIYNTLAASATLLLVADPNLLPDVGFQLSYAAVLGIVYFQPLLAEIFRFTSKAGNYVWGLFTVSVAAQMTTFPLSCFYFQQFPLFFWMSNFIVIPAAFLFIGLGMLILVTSPLPWISGFLAHAAALLVRGVYTGLQAIEGFPGSLVSGFNFSLSSLIISFTILFLVVLFLETKRARFLLMTMACASIFFLAGTAVRISQNNAREIILYNHKQPLVHLIYGRRNYIVAPGELFGDDFPEMTVKPVITRFHLGKPVLIPLESEFDDQLVIRKGNYLFFDGVVIGFDQEGYTWNEAFLPAIIVETGETGRNRGYPAGSRVVSYGRLRNDETGNIHHVLTDGAFRVSTGGRGASKISEKLR